MDFILSVVMLMAIGFVLLMASKSVVFIIKSAVAQSKVNKAFAQLTKWRNRQEKYEIYVGASGVEFDFDDMQHCIDKYRKVFYEAIDDRDTIRF